MHVHGDVSNPLPGLYYLWYVHVLYYVCGWGLEAAAGYDQNFLVTFFDDPEGIGIIRASRVESEYPVNPVQPLSHFGCRAA